MLTLPNQDDQKKFTLTNRWNLTKISHQQTLTLELDQNMDEFDQKKSIRRQT